MRWETGLILLTLFQPTNAAAEPEPRRDQGKDELICPKSRVKAAVGEDVTLDCHLEPQRDVTEERFEWKFNESHHVLIYRSRDFSAVDQAEQFRGRASFDSSGNLTEGKLPLNISSVQKTDAGRYSCSVGRGKERISCSTELIIGKDELICPQQVEAAVGEDVTLDCHLEPQRDVTEERFEWKFNESHRVLIYRSRDFSAVDQAEQFRGRASLDSSGNLTEGKLPLNISSVYETDAGRYSCSVGRGTERISCSTELIIDPKTETEDNIDREEVAQDPNPTRKNPKTETEENRHYGLIGTGIIAIILTASLICCGPNNTSAGQHRRGHNRENEESSGSDQHEH